MGGLHCLHQMMGIPDRGCKVDACQLVSTHARLFVQEDTLAANPTAESLDYATSKAGGALGGDAEDVTGLKPQQGLPKDAPSTEAAVGGAAGSIAPLAAAAASGDARSADQVHLISCQPACSCTAQF